MWRTSLQLCVRPRSRRKCPLQRIRVHLSRSTRMQNTHSLTSARRDHYVWPVSPSLYKLAEVGCALADLRNLARAKVYLTFLDA